MISRTLGVYASLALAANAVLLPPNMGADRLDLGDDNALETLAINPLKRTVALECPSCAVAEPDHGNMWSWSQEVGNTFLLDFEVGEQEDTLDIDGVQLYPPAFGHFTEPFYVTQVNPHIDGGIRLRVTGYTFHYNSAETITEAGTELLPMTFRITSIESKPADPPALRINLLKDSNGRLMIASFQTARAEEGSPIEQSKECQEWPLLCKWKAVLEGKLNGMKAHMGKGCHKHKQPSDSNPMEEETTEGKPPHTFRPGHPHHRPNHMDHDVHRHRHHRIQRFFRRVFFTIIIPILIGIFAGTLTYIIGMALGCAIAMIVAKVRGYGPYERVPEEEDEEASDKEVFNEKEVYAELPEYEAPPVYDEAAEKEVVEESK